jgi:hypothetical protein
VCVYTYFILEFCTSLEKLVLYAEKDHFDNESGEGFERALKPMIENDISRISTLKTLEAFTEYYYTPEWSNRRHRKFDIDRLGDFAVPTIQLIKNRYVENTKRAQEDRENADPSATKDETLKCHFSGEEHIWAECYNLCGFCGRFGHFHWSCKERMQQHQRDGGVKSKGSSRSWK